MRRLTAIMALGTLLAMFGGVATASPAFAGRGHKWQFVPAQPFTLPAIFCGFKIRVSFPVNKEYAKVLKTSDGSVTTLTTGALKASFTNLNTGKTITENLSGPAKVTVSANGTLTFRQKGHTGFTLLPAIAKRFGLPTAAVVAGSLTTVVAPNGRTRSMTLHGHVLVNICKALS